MRRAIVKNLGATVLVSCALPARPSSSTEPAHLEVKDPAAIALGYVLDAARVDVKKYPQYVQGSKCENCLQLQGSPGNTYRPCGLFPGKLVSVSGWCSGWTAEM
jgi:High potential iron-sulfur protein